MWHYFIFLFKKTACDRWWWGESVKRVTSTITSMMWFLWVVLNAPTICLPKSCTDQFLVPKKLAQWGAAVWNKALTTACHQLLSLSNRLHWFTQLNHSWVGKTRSWWNRARRSILCHIWIGITGGVNHEFMVGSKREIEVNLTAYEAANESEEGGCVWLVTNAGHQFSTIFSQSHCIAFPKVME